MVDRLNNFHGATEEVCSGLFARLDAAGEQLCDNVDPMEREAVMATLQEQHAVTSNSLQETRGRLEAEIEKARSAAELLKSNGVKLQETLSTMVAQLNGAKEEDLSELHARLNAASK